MHGHVRFRYSCIRFLVGADFLKSNLLFETDLRLHTHIHQDTLFFIPSLQTGQVLCSLLIVDDKWCNAMAQTLLKHKQSANAAIAVIKGANLLEPDMKL